MAAKLEDSNMADYGSDAHRAKNKEAAEKEEAWQEMSHEVGMQIWRMEQFKVKAWPKDKYGEFYGGDSYIILNTKENDEGKKKYDVFFWLGSETTQDEAGTAAYKTVELDDYLGDDPVQYREVQGCESKKFQDLFGQITILKGGVETGFNHVEPKDYIPRLMHICGEKAHVQVYQVELDAKNLNDSSSFVLDAGLKVFQFNGTKSTGWEKRKANSIVDGLESSRHGKVKETLIIDGLAEEGKGLIEEFWTHFGGKPDSIADKEPEAEMPNYPLSLHKVSDAGGKMEIEEVCSGKMDKAKLTGNDAFLLDGGHECYVWIGQGANKAEKKEAMIHAGKYLAKSGRGTSVPVARVMEGNEPAEFWKCFNGGD